MNTDTKIPAHDQCAGIFAVYYLLFRRNSPSDCRRRSEQFLDVCGDGRRDFRRLEALDDRAVAVDEELREVPLDAVAFEVLREVLLENILEHCGVRMLLVESLEAFLLREVLEERLGRFAADIALLEDLERHAVVVAAELLDLFVAARILCGELVAREAEDFKALVFVGEVELLQLVELRREAALAGRVDDQQDLALVVCQRLFLALTRLDREIVDIHDDLPFSCYLRAMRFYVVASLCFTAALGLPYIFLRAMFPVYVIFFILSNQI